MYILRFLFGTGILASLLWVTPLTHAQYLYDKGTTGQLTNFYYGIAEQKESEIEKIAIRNLTQTLRSYGPADSKYLTEERVHNMVFAQNAADLAVLLAEMRRKAEYETTTQANADAQTLSVEERGKVYNKLSMLEQNLKQRASEDNASRLAPDAVYSADPSKRPWHDLIMSGDVLQLFTATEINEASTLVRSLYDLELDLATLQVELSTDQTFSTLFENGSLDDSFYDLVEDINQLDRIWYGEAATEFSASWLSPKELPAEYQDPRQQPGYDSAPNQENTLRIEKQNGVFVPQTNKPTSTLPESLASQEQAVQVSSFLDARAEDRMFMPLIAEKNTNIEIPGNHKKFCDEQGYFCLKVDINILSYPLLGSGDFSLVQQLREWKAELSDMSQKNLTIKTVGKNIFEIGLTPGANLGELLDMNIITSSKPMSFPAEQKPVEERATDLMERIKGDLKNCQDSAILATNSISRGGSSVRTPAANIIAAQQQAQEACASVLATQDTLEHQELHNEHHSRTLTQFNVMTQIIKNILFEMQEIHTQTITIEGKPRK